MMKRSLHGRYEMYRRYQILRRRINPRLTNTLGGLAIVVCVVGSIAIADNYIVITPEQIIHDPFFGIREQRWSTDDVERIDFFTTNTFTTSGEVERHYELVFADGARWDTHFVLPLLYPQTRRDVIESILNNSEASIGER